MHDDKQSRKHRAPERGREEVGASGADRPATSAPGVLGWAGRGGGKSPIGAWLDARGEGMEAIELQEETEATRARLRDRLIEDGRAASRAVQVFEGALRRRAARPILEQRLAAPRVVQTLQRQMVGYLRKQVTAVAELTPFGQAVDMMLTAKESFDGHVRAIQEEARLDAISMIVKAAEEGVWGSLRDGMGRIDRASPREIAILGAKPHPGVDERGIVARLDAMLLVAMRGSGTESVAEQIDALHDRDGLGDEVAAERKIWAR